MSVKYQTYSHFEKAIADKIPESCKCGWTEKYGALKTGPWIIKRTETGIGTVISLICPKCKNKIDITPYEFW